MQMSFLLKALDRGTLHEKRLCFCPSHLAGDPGERRDERPIQRLPAKHIGVAKGRSNAEFVHESYEMSPAL